MLIEKRILNPETNHFEQHISNYIKATNNNHEFTFSGFIFDQSTNEFIVKEADYVKLIEGDDQKKEENKEE